MVSIIRGEFPDSWDEKEARKNKDLWDAVSNRFPLAVKEILSKYPDAVLEMASSGEVQFFTSPDSYMSGGEDGLYAYHTSTGKFIKDF